MATKWADYIITAVRFNSAATHIEAVEIRADNGDSVGPASEATRAQIVDSIESGTTFCTATATGDQKWHKGAEVKVVVIDNQKFIKTKSDNSKADNLDNLPTF
jgi:uncharacterized protein (DUF2147 family)